jgi:hypothetical protein
MEDLLLEGTEETPTVHLQLNGDLSLKGHSYPEDALEFYSPILGWLEEYKNSMAEATTATFNMTYFNSSSTILLLKILTSLGAMHKSGHGIQVVWMHEEGDTLMADKAEEMKSMVDLPFEIKVG